MGNLCSVSISTEATLSRCWDCVVGQASYTCKLEQNLKSLKVELKKLKARRDDVNQRVISAQHQRMMCLNEVQLWLDSAATMIAQVEEFIERGPREVQKLCLAGCFSTNCKSSYKFGREVATKLEEIVALKDEGVFEQVASQNELEAAVDVRPAVPTVGLESTFIKVCSLLERKEVGMLGLYGLGGVGKTTLLTQIYNKLLISNNVPDGYDAIFWIVVSKDHSTETVQAKIGEELRLPMESWNHKSSDKKSQEIHRAFSEKKFVLFLDDIWEHVDLIKVGVPLPDQESGSKVVFTTRLYDVCSQMGANEKIEVRCLGDDEAWALFQRNVGDDTLSRHPDIRGFAKDVAAECRGLPLALIVIGRAMAGKNSPASWEYAIEVLKNSAHQFAETAKEVYPVLKFSYDNLPSDTMRSCLLYCCLYPEDHSIEKSSLIEYWYCEGLLDEFESISKARLQGHHIIDSLLNASLLQQVNEYMVKMHDVIHDMALWISCKCEEVEKKRFYVKAGLQLTEAPEVGKWQGVRRVSFMGNQIKCLTSTPTCPKLQTLFLNKNKDLCRIENGFFQFMPNLKVLKMSGCGELRKLPEGISYLVSLECLDLSGTKIEELPMELKSLTKLKCLDLRWMEDVVRILDGLICSFSKLQVFRLYNWNIRDEGKVWIGGEEERGLIEELGSLQYLNLISIEMEGAFALQRLLRFHNLQTCIEQLRLRDFSEAEVFNVSWLANMKSLNTLRLFNCERVKEMIIDREGGEGRIMLDLFPTINTTLCFHSLERVFLSNCGKLKDMTWLILAPNLRRLWVDGCSKMEEIITVGEVGDLPFPKLEWLELHNLPELKSIYPKALPFLSLREITVRNCSKLKKLPLNADSAKGNNLSIQGRQKWWTKLEWEDEATRIAFLPSFKP